MPFHHQASIERCVIVSNVLQLIEKIRHLLHCNKEQVDVPRKAFMALGFISSTAF